MIGERGVSFVSFAHSMSCFHSVVPLFTVIKSLRLISEFTVSNFLLTGKWNDAHCAEKKGFICEQVQGVPQPTTRAPIMSGYCPAGFSTYRNKCYKVFTTPKTWKDANTACMALGGGRKGYYLASISNLFENGMLLDLDII